MRHRCPSERPGWQCLVLTSTEFVGVLRIRYSWELPRMLPLQKFVSCFARQCQSQPYKTNPLFHFYSGNGNTWTMWMYLFQNLVQMVASYFLDVCFLPIPNLNVWSNLILCFLAHTGQWLSGVCATIFEWQTLPSFGSELQGRGLRSGLISLQSYASLCKQNLDIRRANYKIRPKWQLDEIEIKLPTQ